MGELAVPPMQRCGRQFTHSYTMKVYSLIDVNINNNTIWWFQWALKLATIAQR